MCVGNETTLLAGMLAIFYYLYNFYYIYSTMLMPVAMTINF